MRHKPKSQAKTKIRPRRKTHKRVESETLGKIHQAEETIEATMAEEPIGREGEAENEKPILTREGEAVREVLETVAKMPYPGIGLRTIAGILRGETRANWLSYIARTESWGVFFPNPLPIVENFIKELVRLGYLEGTHFVRLTERGKRVLEDQEQPTARRRLKLISRKVRPLLWKLLLLRAKLANERKSPGLFKDELVIQLLEKQPNTLEELKKLKGVGKFIAQNLGEEIVQIIRSFRNSQEDDQKD